MKGKWFHTPMKDDEGEINGVGWQGNILAEPSPGVYLVQLFSWLSGAPTDQVLVPFEDMRDWVFYDSNDDMVLSYEHGAGTVASWQRVQEKVA